jgi:hypothetical protein
MTRNWFARRSSQPWLEHRASPLRLESLEDRATPATFTVNSTADDLPVAGDGKLTLREAITKANLDPATADTIVVPAGVYKIALDTLDDDANTGGDFDILGSVTIQGAGVGRTIIDGQKKDRVFDVRGTSPSSIRAVFQGVTIRNGEVSGHGGGILVGNADLVVRDSAVTGNGASESGGGVSNGAAPGTRNVKVVRSTVARNVAGIDGGGVYAAGADTDIAFAVTDSAVWRNIAGDDGGGIWATTANVTRSTISGNIAGDDGGGIFADATGNVTSSTLNGNSAAGGGGGVFASTTAKVTSSTLSGNSAGGAGGGVFTFSTANVTSSTLSGNKAGGGGGGLSAGTANVTNSTLSGNSAAGGGGLGAGTANVTNSTLSGNFAAGDGGGVFTSIANVTNSTLSGNTAGRNGGGILAENEANLTNATISGNTAGGNGGGIWAPAAELLNCTVVENMAFTGGGLYHATGGDFTLRNTIVALNLVGFMVTGADVSGVFASEGHNLIGDGTDGLGFISTDIVGTRANPIDPKIGALKNNGGKTKTHALLAGSKAIDRGDNTILPLTDQRGFPRVKDGNGDGIARVDIGAFER